MVLRTALIFIFILSGIAQSSSQNRSSLKPRWIGNTPRIESPTFYFVEVHSDMATSLDGARASVLKVLSAGVERTDRISVNEIFEDKSEQRFSTSGKVSGSNTDYYALQLQAEGYSRPIHSRRIDEYWVSARRGGGSVLDYHALYAVERRDVSADFSIIGVTSRYGARGLWRSAIIPGWGQFHKGANLKGGLILGGCALLAGGIVFTENQRADYAHKIKGTHDIGLIRSYSTKRDHFATARNICIGAAAALYLYNLIDAVATPGARRIVVKRDSRQERSYAVAPALLPDGTAGLTAAITF